MKRFVNILVALVFVLTTFASAQPAIARGDAAGLPIDPNAPYVPGEVVVGFASGKSASVYFSQATALAKSMQAELAGQSGSTALLSFAEDADVMALSKQIAGMRGVAFAEPNYIYSIPTPVARNENAKAPTTITRQPKGDAEAVKVPVEVLQSLRTIRNGRIMSTYPNDSNLWWNEGWWFVGADIVSPNTTASANVCELDTGVDYLHKDLSTNILKGYDFVNGDADPMDDNGHGTHVAGVIAAIKNNSEGIAGVSTGKVVAVKVLNAQGWGTNYGVAAGIYYCANRADVKVLSMSLGGGYSLNVDNAVAYAVNTKGKLLVAAAGNANSSTRSYPAGLSTDYPNKVLAVAASGLWTYDAFYDYWWVDNYCRADYSNYGDWVSVIAPGTDIYSTLPWDKPFYLGYYEGFNSRYDWLSGTSMATPFVAAAAARRWGYTPTATNAQVGLAVKNSGDEVYADDVCWPASMAGIRFANVASLLDRAAMYGLVYNATTGLPLTNAQFQVYQGATLRDTGVVSSIWSGYAEGINLPVGSGYTAKVNLAGVTAGSQPAFWHAGLYNLNGGWWYWLGRASVPNKSGNFDVVTGWRWSGYDLDTDVWLPNTPNPLDAGQPAPFIVGPEGNAFGYLENDPTGTLMAFPYAIYNRDGGWYDWTPMESITIAKRAAHGVLAANPALPYYAGDYYVGITDYGEMDGADHALYWAEPVVYIWKDGAIKVGAYTNSCNAEWWFPFKISSGVSGTVPTFTFVNACGSSAITPYSVVGGLTGSSNTGTFMQFTK